MFRDNGRTAALALTMTLTQVLIGSQARAQSFYGPGYWGGYGGGGQTVAGNAAQGAAYLAAGMGQYNVETAQARAINANTAMKFNEYMYQSKLEGERVYTEKLGRDKAREAKGTEATRSRLRDNPNEVDIARGDALNVAMTELSDPKVFDRSIASANRFKIGGELIRDIPFNYASAAITVSVHQLTQGGAPAVLKERPEFAPDRTALRAIAAQIRQEGEESGSARPETLQKAKDLITAARTKVETVLAKGSSDRVAADKYLKALYGFVRMMETPAVDVLLAGVEKHPEATLGDLIKFMESFNLRFGASQTPRQKAVYQQLYPMLIQVRDEVNSQRRTGSPTQPLAHDAPLSLFDNLSYDQLDGKAPPVPAPPR